MSTGLVPPALKVTLDGGFTDLGQFRLVHSRDLATQAEALSTALRRVPTSEGTAKIELKIDKRLGTGYSIRVSQGRALVVGGGATALANATSTVLQLAAQDGTLPLGVIDDKPDVEFRGLLLDVARQWHSVETIRQVITLCWLYKVNYLQLHLTDDQSFTFPTESLPSLPTPGRSYTKQQLRELVLFAKARGVTIIPEIEMPGHGGQMVSKMPDLFRAHALHHATLNFAKPEVRTALKNLLAEVMEVFDAPYMHIGGDEADLAHVHETASFQEAMRAKQLDNPQELFRDFINEMNQTVRAKGKKMIVWEGFGPEGKVPVSKDIVVQNFESAYYPPDRMAAAGYTMINASWKPLYVVNDRNWTPEEIYGWNYRRWEHFIEGFPSYKGIQLDSEAKVLGAMMCAWEQPQEREIPSLRERLPAMAERLWRANTKGTYEDFAKRLKSTDALLTKLLTETAR